MLLRHLWKGRLSWDKARQCSQPVIIALDQQGEIVLDQQNKQKRAEVTKTSRNYLVLWGAEQSLALFYTKH